MKRGGRKVGAEGSVKVREGGGKTSRTPGKCVLGRKERERERERRKEREKKRKKEKRVEEREKSEEKDHHQ